MEHAGESGVQFSVGVEVKALGDQAAASSHQSCCKSGEEQAGNIAIANILMIQLAKSNRSHLILETIFQNLNKFIWTENDRSFSKAFTV